MVVQSMLVVSILDLDVSSKYFLFAMVHDFS